MTNKKLAETLTGIARPSWLRSVLHEQPQSRPQAAPPPEEEPAPEEEPPPEDAPPEGEAPPEDGVPADAPPEGEAPPEGQPPPDQGGAPPDQGAAPPEQGGAPPPDQAPPEPPVGGNQADPNEQPTSDGRPFHNDGLDNLNTDGTPKPRVMRYRQPGPGDQQAIRRFLKKNSKATDDDFHTFLRGMGIDPQEGEKTAMKLARASREEMVTPSVRGLVGLFVGEERECDSKGTNKPWRTSGGSKKFAVCGKEGDETKLVRFGDPNMEIKRDSPERRKNFRARHGCATPGPKTKAKYWACKTWEGTKKVSDVVESLVGLFLNERKDLVPGGKGDKLPETAVDPEQLRMGIAVELEHTKNKALAKEIALDHLKENPRYYTMLKKIHKESEESGSDMRDWQHAEERAHKSGDPEHHEAAKRAFAKVLGHRDDVADNMDSGGGPEQSERYANTWVATHDILPGHVSHPEHHVRQVAKVIGLKPQKTPGHFVTHDADHAYSFADVISDHYGVHDAVKLDKQVDSAGSSTLGSPVHVNLDALKIHKEYEEPKSWRRPDINSDGAGGEFGEIKNRAAELGISHAVLANAIRRGKVAPLSDEHWAHLQNTSSWETVTHKKAKALAKQADRDYDRVVKQIESGAVAAPMVLYRPGKPPYLVGGNTRLMAARAMGVRPHVINAFLPGKKMESVDSGLHIITDDAPEPDLVVDEFPSEWFAAETHDPRTPEMRDPRTGDKEVGCVVVIPLPFDLANQFPRMVGPKKCETPPHVTVLHVGKLSPAEYTGMIDVVQKVISKYQPFFMDMHGADVFDDKKDYDVLYANATSRTFRAFNDGIYPTLNVLHAELRKALEDAGIDVQHDYGKNKGSKGAYAERYMPHATIAYIPKGEQCLVRPPTGSWFALDIECWGWEKIQLQLGKTVMDQPAFRR